PSSALSLTPIAFVRRVPGRIVTAAKLLSTCSRCDQLTKSTPVSATCTSSSAAAVNRWPAPICSVIRIAETRSPLRSTSRVVASAPPRIRSTASAARAGLRSRGGTGSLREAGPDNPAVLTAGFSLVLNRAPTSESSNARHYVHRVAEVGSECEEPCWFRRCTSENRPQSMPIVSSGLTTQIDLVIWLENIARAFTPGFLVIYPFAMLQR